MPASTALPFYLYPVNGYQFGEVTASGALHDGIDLGTPIGTPVTDLLPGEAKVTKAGKFPWGGEVDITGKTTSGQMFTEVLAHLDQIFVQPNQKVTQGQVLGSSGGENLPPQYSTGPHTHLGFFENGQAISPDSVLEALGLGTAASNGVTQAGTAGQGGTSDGSGGNPAQQAFQTGFGTGLGGALGFGPEIGQGITQAVAAPGSILSAIQSDLERAGFFILALMIILFGGLVLFWPSIKEGAGTAAKAVAL